MTKKAAFGQPDTAEDGKANREMAFKAIQSAKGIIAEAKDAGSQVNSAEEQLELWHRLIRTEKTCSHLSVSKARAFAKSLRDAELPQGAAWCAVPKEDSISKDYWISLNSVFRGIIGINSRAMNDGVVGPFYRSMNPAPKFANERRSFGRIMAGIVHDTHVMDKLPGKSSRLYSDGRTEEKLAQIAEKQPGDFIILPIQWGKGRLSLNIQSTVRRFGQNEFFLTLLMGASLIYANPRLVLNEEDPWFGCPGSQLYSDAEGRADKKFMCVFCAERTALNAMLMDIGEYHPGLHMATGFAI